MHLLLEYSLVDDYLERRTPLRDDHLALARAAHERGELLLAGALPDPYDRASWCGRRPASSSSASPSPTPTSSTGWSRGWTVRDWNVVIG